METSVWLVLAAALAGDIIVFLASTLMLAHRRTVAILTTYATPFAAGALLAAAFLDFLHEGVENYEPMTVLTAALAGVIFFFLLEGWLHWFHHHSREPFESAHEHHKKAEPITVLVTSGNWLHNFIDGAAIAGAFLIGLGAGVITTLAVALHEIPREVADSGYLLKRGATRKYVIMVHGLAIVATTIGTALFYTLAKESSNLLAILLGSTAGFFIYIAASDIIPSINAGRKKSSFIDWQVALVVIGAVLVGAAILFAHQFIAE